MEENKNCPICGNNRCNRNLPPIIKNFCFDFHCSSCGDFKMYEQDAEHLPIPDSEKFILAGYLRETKDTRRECIILKKEKIEEILDSASVPDGPLEAIDRILKYVDKNSKTAASFVPLEDEDYPIAYAKDVDEFNFFKDQAVDLKYLERGDSKDTYQSFRLTLNGRARVDSTKKIKEPGRAFVAMWFDKKLQEAFDKAIKPALEETGYKAVRIDLVEHNEKIDDKIIEEIRKSDLLIADFTGHRGGVYFESGFARALGIPVVWTCREDHLRETHFDTRQYNHIVWKTPEYLKKKLKNRIEATIPIAR